MKFAAFIKPMGNNTGILVPPEIRDALDGGKNPLVKVTLAGHSWGSKIATMGGDLLIGVTADIRKLTGVTGGETHEVTLELDDKPRLVEAPEDLKAALAASPAAQAAWDKLAPSHKKAHVAAIEGAKAADTRARRVAKAIETLTS
jgi:pimeloyl-ACP methyl ester carboxylesterase